MSKEKSGLSLVVAIARDGAIGLDGALPWPRFDADMRWFMDVTMGNVVIMGRKTWESLPKRSRPLFGRTNVVLSRDADARFDGAIAATSLGAALSLVDSEPGERMVIGGASLYAEALPLASRIYLTDVDMAVKADRFFDFDRSEFDATLRRINGNLRFSVLERKRSSGEL